MWKGKTVRGNFIGSPKTEKHFGKNEVEDEY